MPAPSEESLLPNPFARIRNSWSAQSRTRREVLTLTLALAFGVLVLPWLIWIAGALALGPYARGGAFRFIGDFYTALAQGHLAFWLIALGPLVFWTLLRLMWVGLSSRTG